MNKLWENGKIIIKWLLFSFLFFMLKELWLIFYLPPNILISNNAVFLEKEFIAGSINKVDQDLINRQKSWWENKEEKFPGKINDNWQKLATDIWVVKIKSKQIFIFGERANLQKLLTTKIDLNSDGWIILSKGKFPPLNDLQIEKFFPPQKWIIYTGKRLPRKLKAIAENFKIPLISSRKTFGLSLNFSQENWQLKVHKK